MSIFGKIVSSIFGSAKTATSEPNTGTAQAFGSQPSEAAQAAAVQAASTIPEAKVDVEAVLTGLAEKNQQKLDWRKSIVDLMKLLDLDSSLAARKELAGELGYTGDTNDSASMNVWLHKQIMQKLSDHGGKVPDDLKN